jgi:hypothetical protein
MRRRGGDELDHAFDSLRDSGKTLTVAFSGEEPLHEELARDGRLERLERWPNLDLEMLPGVHHSLREINAQHAAHQAIDQAIIRDLARLPVEHGKPTSDEQVRAPRRPTSRETT